MVEKDKLPKYPDLPWSSIEKGSFVPLRAEDVSSRVAVEELIGQIFDKAETRFYLYTQVGQPIPDALLHAEGRGEIRVPIAERPFYLHKAGGDHSFSQLEEASPDGVEYQRFTLALTEKKQRELTIEQHLAMAKSTKECDPILQLRPNVSGFGIDLRALWRRLRGK